MHCHVMILLPFLVSFLKWCLWRFQLWCWIWWWRLTQIGACHTGLSCWGLFVQGLFPRTVSAYHSGIRWYVAFCLCLHLQPFPLSDLTLCHFVSSLYTQCLSHSSICSYLSSLRFLQIFAGGPDPGPGAFPQLHYVVRVVGHLSPWSNRPARLPVTPDIVAHLWAVWSASLVSYTNCILWAACYLGFAAFLHSGEFTCPSIGVYNFSMLSWGDVLVDSHTSPTLLVVRLRHSKTDVFGTRVSLYVGATGSPNCPVAVVLAYTSIRPPRPGPFLWSKTGDHFHGRHWWLGSAEPWFQQG